MLMLYNEIFVDCVGMEFQKCVWQLEDLIFWEMEGAALYDEDDMRLHKSAILENDLAITYLINYERTERMKIIYTVSYTSLNLFSTSRLPKSDMRLVLRTTFSRSSIHPLTHSLP